MPRISRESIISPYIHVIIQGIDKEYIFQKNEYKLEYLKLLKKNISEFDDVKLLAYCVMDNHIHLLIYTENVNELSKVMSRVNTSYGIFYNKSMNRVGYVFRNRYYTQQILDKKHLWNVLAYIHKNPVKAKIVKSEKDYKYSSYNDFINNNINKEIINLIFNDENYINQFYYIHKNYSENNIIDIKDDIKTTISKVKNIVKNFCTKYNVEINIAKKDNYLLKKLVSEIKNNSDASNKLICEHLGIGKNRITNLKK